MKGQPSRKIIQQLVDKYGYSREQVEDIIRSQFEFVAVTIKNFKPEDCFNIRLRKFGVFKVNRRTLNKVKEGSDIEKGVFYKK